MLVPLLLPPEVSEVLLLAVHPQTLLLLLLLLISLVDKVAVVVAVVVVIAIVVAMDWIRRHVSAVKNLDVAASCACWHVNSSWNGNGVVRLILAMTPSGFVISVVIVSVVVVFVVVVVVKTSPPPSSSSK